MSTLEQSGDGISLANQRARIEAWCLANGYDLAGTFIETMSGARATNRPQLQAALNLACREKGVLVVYSLSPVGP